MMLLRNTIIMTGVFLTEMIQDMITVPSVIRSVIICVAFLVFSLIFNIMIHEAGHLVLGLLSGYRFSSLECFGILLVRTAGGLKLTFSKEPCAGQCIMYPDSVDSDGSLLIAGGVIAQCFASVVSFCMLFADPNPPAGLFFIIFGTVGTVTAITNSIPYNGTNDGSTFADARKSCLHMEAYNKLMIIYRELNLGNEIGMIDERWFIHPEMPLSPISRELSLYRSMRVRGKYHGCFGEDDRSDNSGDSHDDPASNMGTGDE